MPRSIVAERAVLNALILLGSVVFLLFSAQPAQTAEKASAYEVFQDLEELTRRIERLESKPYEKLIDENGNFQPEIVIFSDIKTGAEVWSLTRELCYEISGKCVMCSAICSPWSCNGRYVVMMSSRRRYDARNRLGGGQIPTLFILETDMTCHKPLWVDIGGTRRWAGQYTASKVWDQRVPNWLYYVAPDKPRGTVWRARIDRDRIVGEEVCKLPNHEPRTCISISNDNKLCVLDASFALRKDQEGRKQSCYIMDLNRKPADQGFLRVKTMEFGGMTGIDGHDPAHEVSIYRAGISEDGRTLEWVYGGYLPGGKTAFTEDLHFYLPLDDLDARPTWTRRHFNAWKNVTFGKYLRPARPEVGTWEAYYTDFRLPCHAYARRRGKGKKEWPQWCPGGGVLQPSPDGTKIWFHSSMLMPSNGFTGSYFAVAARPSAPDELAVKGAAKGVQLTWKPAKRSKEVKGYHVFRKNLTGDRYEEISTDMVTGTEFVDATARVGETYSYFVTAEEWSTLESDVGSEILTVWVAKDVVTKVSDARGIGKWDSTPPEAPTGLKVAKEAENMYRLQWDAGKDKDLRYYNVYFSDKENPGVTQKRRIYSPPRSTTSILDWSAPEARAVYYAITAVDRQGNESKPTYARYPQGE